jgi:hypothetical protein
MHGFIKSVNDGEIFPLYIIFIQIFRGKTPPTFKSGLKTMRHLALIPASLFLLSGCTDRSDAPPTVGLANPASVYCAKIGGTLELREEAGGTTGYCHLPDGRVVEEWTLYRAAQPEPQSQP